MQTLGDPCVLEDRACIECGECDVCDLDPQKQCDNCCQCLKITDADYAEIGIDDILLNTEKIDESKIITENKIEENPQ